MGYHFSFKRALIHDKAKNSESTERILKLLEIKDEDVRYWTKFTDIPFRYAQREPDAVVLYNSKSFIKKSMAGSKDLICTQFNMFNPTSYCPLDCQYCYQHNIFKYQPIVKLAANIDTDGRKALRKFAEKTKPEPTALVMGEMSDGMLFDRLLSISILLAEIVVEYPHLHFIVLSKPFEDDIKNYLRLPAPLIKNFIHVISINPQKIINTTENYTSSLQERLRCLEKLHNYGYKVRLKIDPMFDENHLPTILDPGEAEALYREMLLKIKMRGIGIDKITLGTFRSFQGLFYAVNKYFPNSLISEIKNINTGTNVSAGKKYLLESRQQIYDNVFYMAKEIFGDKTNVSFCREQKIVFDTYDVKPLNCVCKL